MDSIKGTLLTAAVSLGLIVLFLCQLTTHYHSPYPAITASLHTTETDLQDVGGVAFGFRRLAADLAWIQTLQYYGTAEAGQSEYEFENGIGRYPRFLALCQHATGIDPYFSYVYYYGGAVLGWNLNRLPEAETLLKEGIAHNPTEWRLSQYLAGLAYEKNHNAKKLAVFLEAVVQDPDCPLLMKALLANLYKKQHLYGKAIQMWQVIYNSGDPNYQARAMEQFEAIHRLSRAERP